MQSQEKIGRQSNICYVKGLQHRQYLYIRQKNKHFFLKSWQLYGTIERPTRVSRLNFTCSFINILVFWAHIYTHRRKLGKKYI